MLKYINMLRIKICGITNIEDASAAIQYGADALGFVFYPKSPRSITPEAARSLISMLPPFVSTVGVFVNEDMSELEKTVSYTGLDMVQLHGSEDADYCRSLSLDGVQVIKLLDPDGPDPGFGEYEGVADLFLFDSAGEGAGGTGKKFDWNILEDRLIPAPYLLSGGIGPGDAEIIRLLGLPGR